MIALLGGLGVSAEDIAAVLEAHDLDHNGVLDWPEFLSLMGKQTGSIQARVDGRSGSTSAFGAEVPAWPAPARNP